MVMTTKRTSTKIFEHVCFHEKEILEMHKILVGNGEPDKSLCRQVALIAERQGNVLNELREMRERRKATPYMIIKILGVLCAVAMVYFGYRSLISGQRKIEGNQEAIHTETRITNDLLAPDSTESTVSIRGNVYIPILKTDSANIIHSNKLDSMYEKLQR
jgi:hypothetical protein